MTGATMGFSDSEPTVGNRGDSSSRATLIRGILGAGSIVFLVSSALLIVLPTYFGELLGLTTSETSDWALRMMGATLLALSGQMWLVRSAPEITIRRSAAVMIVAGGAMTVFTVIMPADWTIARFAYLGIGLGFLTAYLVALIRR
ncbi:MAG: hypothetical protein WBJ33_04370 [Candidatus Nanopelagicales bacterium]